jgi:bifunctional non-homologous end joining protein LigD
VRRAGPRARNPAIDSESATTVPEVKLSNPNKVLFPDDGITKAELRAYYEAVADAMVPHTKDRPMVMWRWNKGIAQDAVVQQSIPKGAPEWVGRCEVPRRKGGEITHGMINDADTLRWIAQQNCITPHVWNSRCDLREKPDRLVFDLDPSDEDFDAIRHAALATADMLRELGLTPFAKLSGSRGIHVVAPLKRTRHADEVRELAGELAVRIASRHPDALTTEWRKEKRDGKILVDVARNTYGQTVVAAYAVRALRGAPVSAPVTWDEVADPKLTPHAFTLRTLPERLAAIGDPWADIAEYAATLPRSLS